MTATTEAAPAPAPAPGDARAARRARFRRGWYRLVIPFAVFGLLAGATWLARHLEEPDLGEAGTLAPAGTGQDGSSRLAELLADRGVEIEYVEDIWQGLDALETGGDAVVFVPRPTLLGVALAGAAARSGRGHRVVLVAPSSFQLAISGLPVVPGRNRWASRATDPNCEVPEAVAAGRAAALRNRYLVDDRDQVCYRGGLVRTRGAGSGGAEVFLVGSTDPFRNRRIDEYGNARLAVELLAARDRMVWAGALPFEAGFDLPRPSGPERPERDRGGSGLGSLLAGYPPGVLAGMALAALLALLVALASSRRLGPPVSEPLPVLVPAAEAVAGRGRLYQRSHGREAALAALRAAALRRIVAAAGLPAAPPPEPETVVAVTADRTGLPAGYVRHTLYGPAPGSDEQLQAAVAALDALVAAMTRDRPAGSEGGAP